MNNQNALSRWAILRDEARRLQLKVDSDESMFASAWEIYGSELAGPPSSIGVNKEKIEEINCKMKLLEDFMEGRINLVDEDIFVDGINKADAEISRLQEHRNHNQEKLNQIRQIKELIK